MRVYHITTHAGIAGGGAGIAASRLNRGLRDAGIDSEVLSTSGRTDRIKGSRLISFGNSLGEKIWRRWRLLQLRRMRRRHRRRPSNLDVFFEYDLSCYGKALLEACRGADVLNLHCVPDLMDYPFVLPRLRREVPVVWTLHDLHVATGGCIYPMQCKAFRSICGNCPQLGSGRSRDLSTEIWGRKAKALSRLRPKLGFVTPSEWLASQVRESSLLASFPVQTIPNGVDTSLFRPRDRRVEKERLGLNPDEPVLLFTSAHLENPIKGVRYLLEAIPVVQAAFPRLQFVAIGRLASAVDWPSFVRSLGVKSEEEEMARIYAAADMLAVPSVLENLPNVILEAMACGVPAAGFRVGGMPEAIKDGETGCLAEDLSAPGLAAAVVQLLECVVRDREALSQQCRSRAVSQFALSVQAARYEALYRSLLRDPTRISASAMAARRARAPDQLEKNEGSLCSRHPAP